MKIVFDFGGVLFHWHPATLLARVLPAHVTDDASAGHWVRQVFQGYGGDWGAFDRGEIDADELVQRITRRTRLERHEVQAVVDGVPAHLSPIVPTVSLLERLHAQGLPLYYLSNMPAPFAEHLERTHAFLGRFRAGVFSSRVRLGKPDPAIFALAAERFEAAPGDLVFLDDHVPNVEAARAAGWRALQFVDAAQAEADLHALGWRPADATGGR